MGLGSSVDRSRLALLFYLGSHEPRPSVVLSYFDSIFTGVWNNLSSLWVPSSHAPILQIKGACRPHPCTVPCPTIMRPTLFESDEHPLESTPYAILRSMDGAKAFLNPSLLTVPWLWRITRSPLASDDSEKVRNYGKNMRTILNVTASHETGSLSDSPLYPA